MTEITLSSEPRPLGKSGLVVSPMAWGMWRFAGTDVTAAQARVEAALDAGLTLFDTADIYGPDNDEAFGASEALLGQVFAAAPHLRGRMVLASKGGIRMGVPYDSSPDYIAAAVDASLTRLGVDHLDLWQIHRPDMLAHPAATARALEALVSSGKVRAVGVSNYTAGQTAALAQHLSIPLASIQPEFSALATAPLFDGGLDFAMAHDYAVLAWSPLGQGRLVGGDPRPGRGTPDNNRTLAVKALLKAQGEAYGVGVSAAAYAWVMAHPARPIPIIGTQTPARIAEAMDAFKVGFTRAQWYAILVASLGENLP
jgi:aryl-alcohol dehydrogenase-like predicted oxidoreductase